MDIWYHRDGENGEEWKKHPLLSKIFPSPEGIDCPLHDYLQAFILATEEDRFVVFAPEEEAVLVEMVRPLISWRVTHFLFTIFSDFRELGKLVDFTYVPVDKPDIATRLPPPDREMRLAMWVRLHADMTQHPR